MTGPPSQAGRFKPRKPAKKIRTPAAAAAASQEAPPSRASASASGRGRGRGRSSGGRGGRGSGRGGRAPTPHGAVFFTGNAPPTVVAGSKKQSQTASLSAKRAPGATKGATARSKTLTKKESTEEIVIGQMDVGVGGEVSKAAPVESDTKQASNRRVKSEDETFTETKTSKIQPTVDTYDSDSSEDESRANRTNRPNMAVQPTELPFPISQLPLGIGKDDKRPAMYSCQESQTSQHERNEPVLVDMQQDAPLVSPFVDWNNAMLRQEEGDSMFLFQFPTRLPEIKSAAVPGPVKSEDPMVVSSSLAPDAAQSMSTNVSTRATETNCFDNALARAPAGRLGKIVVYKSGKTELVMGGENGAPEIRMNVTEGLPCGFIQQAVAIDLEESTYVPLGNVKKTVVVTPNVEGAFSS